MAKNGKKNPSAPAGDKPKACYVLSLSVENVRCFGPKQTLDLSDGNGRPAQWTIILGENGTGKTTLLQLMVGMERVPSPIFGGSTDPDNLRPRAFEKYSHGRPWVRVASPHLEMGEAQLRFTATQLSSDGDVFPVHVVSLSPGRGGIGSHYGNEPPPSFVAYGASRRLTPSSFDEPYDDPAGSLFDEHAPLRNAEDWLLRLDYAASKKTYDTSLQRQILVHILRLMNEGLLPGVTDIAFMATEGTNPKPRVEFKTPYGWVPLRRLGYGYQTLIAWMLDFVSRMVERYPDSADPLKEPAICVVDEIDLHLHPAWQRKLIGFLSERFPNTQFIATAHSPLVVQAAENANIAVLRREGDHVIIDNDVDNIRNWRVDQILTSDLFGLPSARSPEVEKLFARRQALLDKKKLSTTEKRELKGLQDKIDRLPVGRSAAENKELDAIRQALDALNAKSPT